MYELRIYNNIGSDVWILPFESMTISEALNKGVSGSVQMNYMAIKRYATKLNTTVDAILSAEYREWRLYKDDTLFYAGVLLHRQFSGSKSQGTALNIELGGFDQLLANRITGNAGTWAYTATDSADIAWDLILQTQADAEGFGNVGITRGTHPVTVDRDNTCRFDNILDEIISMSAEKKSNGYDWEITPTKVFNIYYPARGETQTDIILDDFNIISWQSSKLLVGALANRVIVIGEGGEESIVSASVQDLASQADWYLQEQVLSEKQTGTVANLEAKGQKLLDNIKTPKSVVNLRVNDRNPAILTYDVGDTMPVKIAELAMNELLRLRQRTIQIQRSGEAQVDLSFDYE